MGFRNCRQEKRDCEDDGEDEGRTCDVHTLELNWRLHGPDSLNIGFELACRNDRAIALDSDGEAMLTLLFLHLCQAQWEFLKERMQR